MAGWGLAVSAIIVLTNTAEIAAIYLFEVLGLHAAAESLAAKVLLGCFFIAAMTYVSFRGILISERLQNVLIAVQFTVLIGVSVIALSKVFGGTAGPQAITPKLDWIIPTGISMSSAAQAIILCIFIYWGWDACLAVGEETKDSERTPRPRRGLDHGHSRRHVRPGRIRGPVVRRVRRHRHRPEQSRKRRRRPDHPGRAGRRTGGSVVIAADRLDLRALLDPDHHPADGPRNVVDGGLRGTAAKILHRAPPGT